MSKNKKYLYLFLIILFSVGLIHSTEADGFYFWRVQLSVSDKPVLLNKEFDIELRIKPSEDVYDINIKFFIPEGVEPVYDNLSWNIKNISKDEILIRRISMRIVELNEKQVNVSIESKNFPGFNTKCGILFYFKDSVGKFVYLIPAKSAGGSFRDDIHQENRDIYFILLLALILILFFYIFKKYSKSTKRQEN